MFLRLIIAYLLWAFLGTLGVHRFYLRRGASGAMMLALTLVGSGILISVAASFPDVTVLEEQEFIERMMQSPLMLPAAVLFMIVTLWWLLDLILVAIIVLMDAEKKAREAGEANRFIASTANLDPSFQATRTAAGLSAPSERQSGLPKDYVLPWRRESTGPTQRMYKPGEE